eukprot:3962232-Pleurochrysis_carterae.AAC.1
MIVDHFHAQPGLLQESGDAVGPAKRPREEEKNRTGCACRLGRVELLCQTVDWSRSRRRLPGRHSWRLSYPRVRDSCGDSEVCDGRSWLPRVGGLVKVHFRSQDHTGDTGHPDLMRSRSSEAAAQVHADPGTGLHACLR